MFLSWRLLGSEATGAGENGMLGPDFAVHRDGERVATVTGSPNLLDADGGAASSYVDGDAMHVTDILPDRPGLEIFTVHEGAASAPYGWALRDAATGEVLTGEHSGRDTGRGVIGDVDPDSPGLEYWASMPPGSDAYDEDLGTNQSIRWAADGTTQIVEGYDAEDVRIVDGRDGEVVLDAAGARSNNGTEGNAGLVADVLGDWREELLVRDAASTEIRVYVSTEVTDRKLTTLMHDAQYRAEVARQNTVYNQPSYTSYMLASDTDWADVPFWTTDVAAPPPSSATCRAAGATDA